MSASDGVTREDPVAMTDAPAVSSPPKGSAPTAPTPQDSERRRSGRKVSVPAPFYPVGSEGEETKPPAPATSAPRSGGGARAPRGGSTRAKRTSSTPTSGSAASPDDDVMPFSVMDFVAPSEDLPEGLSTMPAIMPWSGARGRRYFLDYAPTEAGCVWVSSGLPCVHAATPSPALLQLRQGHAGLRVALHEGQRRPV